VAPFSDSPFAALTIVVAPAILTNASSVLCMGTANRLARVVDRTRVVSAELAHVAPNGEKFIACQSQLEVLRVRWTLVLRALKFFYMSLGSFAAAALISALWIRVYGFRPAPRLQLRCSRRAPFGHGGRRRPCLRMHHNDAGDAPSYPESCRRNRASGSLLKSCQ
jgi:hypothetical protein